MCSKSSIYSEIYTGIEGEENLVFINHRCTRIYDTEHLCIYDMYRGICMKIVCYLADKFVKQHELEMMKEEPVKVHFNLLPLICLYGLDEEL
jgi:hypothetical protein